MFDIIMCVCSWKSLLLTLFSSLKLFIFSSVFWNSSKKPLPLDLALLLWISRNCGEWLRSWIQRPARRSTSENPHNPPNMSLHKSKPPPLARPMATKSASNTPRGGIAASMPSVQVASAPSSARGSIRSPRGARVPLSGTDENVSSTIIDSTVKSMKISTRNYSIFVHQKAHGRGDGIAPLEESPDTFAMTSKFVKFLRESKMKVPKFLQDVDKAGASMSEKAVFEEEEDVQVSAKDRIKRYQVNSPNFSNCFCFTLPFQPYIILDSCICSFLPFPFIVMPTSPVFFVSHRHLSLPITASMSEDSILCC